MDPLIGLQTVSSFSHFELEFNCVEKRSICCLVVVLLLLKRLKCADRHCKFTLTGFWGSQGRYTNKELLLYIPSSYKVCFVKNDCDSSGCKIWAFFPTPGLSQWIGQLGTGSTNTMEEYELYKLCFTMFFFFINQLFMKGHFAKCIWHKENVINEK